MKQYTLIKEGSILPEDFLIDGRINREKYIVEFGFAEQNLFLMHTTKSVFDSHRDYLKS